MNFLIKKINFKRKYFLIIFNFFILLINIFFFNRKTLNFKNSDEFIFRNRKNYHNNNISIKVLKNVNSKEKNKISLVCKDMLNNSGCSKLYKKMLEKLNYIVQIDDDSPDFLLYDVFGCEHAKKKYNKSIKIAIYTENIIPDFSEADYAISQSHIIYLDRYYKYPSFIWNLLKFKNHKVETIGLFAKNLTKKRFCAAVISNHGNFTYFRLKFIKELNKYKHVDMGGRYLNDFGRKITNKIKFMTSYKFSISMENSNGDGYISEKIIDSLVAGTIPIYYGDYLIDEYINPKCFIMIKGEKDIHEKIEYIKKIDNDNKLYHSILWFAIFTENKGILVPFEKNNF
jgi:hypothetical protein